MQHRCFKFLFSSISLVCGLNGPIMINSKTRLTHFSVRSLRKESARRRIRLSNNDLVFVLKIVVAERPVDFSLSGGRESRASSDAPVDSDDDEIDVLGDETPSPTRTTNIHVSRRTTGSPTGFHQITYRHSVTLSHQPQQPIQRAQHRWNETAERWWWWRWRCRTGNGRFEKRLESVMTMRILSSWSDSSLFVVQSLFLNEIFKREVCVYYYEK